MCRLCLPNTSLEQHFKYFTESGMRGKDIVDLVIKYHRVSPAPRLMEKDFTITVSRTDYVWGERPVIDAESRPVHKELPAPSSNPKKCPECGSFHLDTYIPSDGGPEPPKVICWDCGWWNEI